jgi:integrase
LNASSLNQQFKKAAVRSGIRPVEMRLYKQRDGSFRKEPYVELTFHDTRHAWASWCLSSGMPPTAVMKWGGWEDAKTMSIYEHFIPSGFEVDLLNAAIERESATAA